jgi:hypothetical protein
MKNLLKPAAVAAALAVAASGCFGREGRLFTAMAGTAIVTAAIVSAAQPPDYRGYAWVPAHWERDPDGYWRLVPGHWVRA